MKCETVMDMVLKADVGRVLLRTRLHFLVCPSCRRECARLRGVILDAKKVPPFRAPEGLSDRIMHAIELMDVEYHHRISQGKWLTAGGVLTAGIFLLPFSDALAWLNTRFGDAFDIPLQLVLGISITIYAAVFIGSHLEYLRRIRWIKKTLKS
jgi:hypothetical protein